MRALISDLYAQALAGVRSCLSALADLSSYEPSVDYEHLLLDVDGMHGGLFPAAYPVTGTLADLHRRAEAGLDELASLGANALTVELIIARLEEIGRSHSRDPPHRTAHIAAHSPASALTFSPLVVGSAVAIVSECGGHSRVLFISSIGCW